MRCCGNCFWSFSPEDEEQLEGYDEYDLNVPKAGDCCIGQDHGETYCCSHHDYIEGLEEYENFIFYDDEYLGPGYLIVSKLDDEMVQFIKISSYGDLGFNKFFIRAYEKNSIDKFEQEFRKITITVNNNDPLYNVIYSFAKSLGENEIKSADPNIQGQNSLSAEGYLSEASLIITKDVYGVKHSTDFVDIYIGDNDSCEFYNELKDFYDNLSTITIDRANEKDIKQLLLKKI